MDLDKVAHDEPPHQDQRCLQIHLFSSLVLKELIAIANNILVDENEKSFGRTVTPKKKKTPNSVRKRALCDVKCLERINDE